MAVATKLASFSLIPKSQHYVSKGAKWLESTFHFSFADYWNPERQNFGVLRVLNDDIIAVWMASFLFSFPFFLFSFPFFFRWSSPFLPSSSCYLSTASWWLPYTPTPWHGDHLVRGPGRLDSPGQHGLQGNSLPRICPIHVCRHWCAPLWVQPLGHWFTEASPALDHSQPEGTQAKLRQQGVPATRQAQQAPPPGVRRQQGTFLCSLFPSRFICALCDLSSKFNLLIQSSFVFVLIVFRH